MNIDIRVTLPEPGENLTAKSEVFFKLPSGQEYKNYFVFSRLDISEEKTDAAVKLYSKLLAEYVANTIRYAIDQCPEVKTSIKRLQKLFEIEGSIGPNNAEGKDERN